MNLELNNKYALVAGASTGLGYASAKALFNEGARVAICSRDKDRITAAANSLSDDTEKAYPIVCDLTQKENIDKLLGDVNDKFGRIDILVANCGGPPLGRHDSVTEKEWELAYNLTFMSAIRMIQGVIPGMKERKFGRIILITSMSAKQPIDNLMLSNTYRSGLLGFAKTLSLEVASHGITVNTVLPGYTRTERLDYFAEEISSASGQSKDDIFSGWENTVPVHRLGKPEELGSLVAYLASEQAGYVTGTAIACDGGRSAGIL